MESIEATSDTNLRIVLKEPQPQNPGNSMMVLPEHIWKDIKDPAEYRNDTDSVGSGLSRSRSGTRASRSS